MSVRADAVLMLVAGVLALTAAAISARGTSGVNYFYLGIGLAPVVAGVVGLRRRG